jgi:hypothetical protein
MPFIDDKNKVFNPTNMAHVSLASSVLGLILAGKNIAAAEKQFKYWYYVGILGLGVAGYMIIKSSLLIKKGG